MPASRRDGSSIAKWLSFGLILAGVLLMTLPVRAGVLDASWTAPTKNTDGTQLTDLSHYRVYYEASDSPCHATSFLQVASPTSTPSSGHVVGARLSGLSTGTRYYVAVSAVDKTGRESSCSSAVSAVAQISYGVSPTTTVGFGSLKVGSFADRTFTVSNSRGGTVSGIATATAPFSIVSGGSFTLSGLGATKTVTVRFSPTTSATASANVRFSADGDSISRLVTGTGTGSTTTSPSTSTVLSVSPSSIVRGSTVTATWSGIAAPKSTDWIGLYVRGAADSARVAWIYVSCSQTAGSARASGSCSLRVPATAATGTYELRLFAGNTNTRLATSGALTVTGTAATLSASPTSLRVGSTVTATWSGIAAPKSTDWIGLYVRGAANSAYVAWIYVSCSQTAGSGKASGSCALRVPTTAAAGTYELRLFTANSYTRLATSNTFSVTR